MAKIRIPIVLNKGRIGIPLHKLGAIVKETETYLRMLAEDIDLPGDKNQWLGLDFQSGSLNFTAEYIPPVEPLKATQFVVAFVDVRHGRPVPSVRSNTRYQYAKIAEQLDEDELIEFSLYKDPESTIVDVLALSKRDIPAIIGEIQGPVESFGSIQGVIHSVFMGSFPRHFFIRELSTGDLIKCVYSSAQYPDLAKALREEAIVVHVYGLIKMDMVNRRVEQMTMQNIEGTEKLSTKDFEEFFGSCPNFTGQLSTQEFIDQVRGRNDKSKALH